MSSHPHSSLVLSENILSLRAAAIAIYDKGFAVGKKPEELTEDIAPLTKMLERLIEKAVKVDLPGCAMAIQRFETQVIAHRMDYEFLLEKARNAQHHANAVRQAVIDEMKKEGVTEKRSGDFTFVVVTIGEKEILTLR